MEQKMGAGAGKCSCIKHSNGSCVLLKSRSYIEEVDLGDLSEASAYLECTVFSLKCPIYLLICLVEMF
jgi:hypothetical protein